MSGINSKNHYLSSGWLWLLAFGVLCFGSINTITYKFADKTVTTGRAGYPPHKFYHPLTQTFTMFCGMSVALWVHYARALHSRCNKQRKPVLIAPFSVSIMLLFPALCDLIASVLLQTALLLTFASVYQMLRSSVILFTATLSVLWLKKKMYPYQWVGMALVLVGTSIVGLSSILTSAEEEDPVWGIVLVLLAQVVLAVEVVYEEKVLDKYQLTPAEGAGLEGAWGIPLNALGLAVAYFIPSHFMATGRLEDVWDAVCMLRSDAGLLLATVASACSVAVFHFLSVTVTVKLSSATRMILDSARSAVVWAVSVLVGWQNFSYMQLVGFLILMCGTATYNAVFRLPRFEYPPPANAEAGQPLMNSTEDA